MLYGCQTSVNQTESETTTNTTTKSTYVTYDDDDAYTTYDSASATSIDLNQESGDVQITKAGTYILSGTLKDGMVQIQAGSEDVVRIVLENASITNLDGAAISCLQAKKLIVSLPEGTTNTLLDGSTYSDVSEEAPTAALYAKDDMTINGTGTLHVSGNANDAITSKDTLKLMEGTYEITSVDDGIVGRDFLYIHSGTYTINAQGDGYKTTYDTDSEKGDMIIEGGNFNVVSGNDGFQAEHDLTIYDGTFKVETGGGSVNGSTASNANQPGGFGMWKESTVSEDTPSAKGIKASGTITLEGGSYQMDTSDDAIHSNNTLVVNSGTYTITSGDDGFHSDVNFTINGGSVSIDKSVEGIEACVIDIIGGDIQITSSDDGVNATASNAPDTDPIINLRGGTLQVDASGDGLDSNGNILMEGGKVVVLGPENTGNGALDYDGSFTINGGTLFAVGFSGMAQSPSNNSTQQSIIVNLTSTQSAGSQFYLRDDSGDVMLGIAPTKTYNSVVISSPSLQKDATYEIYTGGTGGTTNDAGYIEYGISGGTLVERTTLSNVLTTVGTSSGMGGMGGGKGGMGRGSETGEVPTDRGVPMERGEMPSDGEAPSDMPM